MSGLFRFVIMMMSCCGTSYAQWCDPVLFEQILGPYPEQESYFGSDIYVSGDMAIVGAQGHVVDGLRTGAVHVYRNDGNRWNFESLITPSDVENDSLFGVWISVDDGSMLIGSYETGVTSATGKVYCYRYIDGQSGAVYVFEYDGKQWVEVQKLTASDGTAGDLFGVTPNLLGDRLVVGAPDHLEEGWFKGSGAVYIFEFDGNEWQEAAKLSPTPFEFGHRFGYELWLMEDMVLIADLAGSQMGRSGEVLVYEYAGGDWLRTDVLESPEPNSVDLYGGEIEVQGDVMLVGAPDAGGGIGTAYVYRLIDGVWHASGEINSPLDDPTQSFGARMELFGDSVMIGSPLAFGRRGHVSVFELDCRGCRVDLTGEGRVNFLDISAMMTLFINGDMAADFSGDGGLDFFDLSAFLSAYEGGCP